ncbi:MAG: hypothetical protein KJ645_13245, partial [Planctomycetes bacterium]|nr:hypothetical protein [Planctomycetota bacterium]
MLLDLGYAPEAADFILLVKTEESPFSPKSFQEFKDINAKYRRVAGMETTPVPVELRAAADELV